MIIGAAIITVLALLVSFWPASRGHWSALLLAVPGLLAGLLLLLLFAGPHSDLGVKLVAGIPTLLAVGSLVLWARKRRLKRQDQIRHDEKTAHTP
jgi:hypothetical protein